MFKTILRQENSKLKAREKEKIFQQKRGKSSRSHNNYKYICTYYIMLTAD